MGRTRGENGKLYRLRCAVHDPSALAVNLPAVSPGGERIAVAADGDALEFSKADFAVEGSLRLDGRIERLDRDGFRLRARLGGILQLECGRCLGPVERPLDEALDLVYLPQCPVPAASGSRPRENGSERPLEASDMNVSFYEGDSLDLRATFREQVHLAVPVKPLCSEDCLGLCPSCGADQNRGPGCRCGDLATRPTGGLAGLRNLLAPR